MYVKVGSIFHTVKDCASLLIPLPHLEGFFVCVQSSGVTFLVTDYGNRMPSEAILPFSQSGNAPASKPYFPSQFRILAHTKSKILVLYNKGGNEDGIRDRQSNPAILPHQFWKRPGCWKRGGISLELSVTPSHLSVGTGRGASCAGRASSSCVRARDTVG